MNRFFETKTGKRFFLIGWNSKIDTHMKTIVWDVDDVLNDLMRAWFETWRTEYPSCPVSYEGLRQNPPHDILGITVDEYLQSLDAFRQSPSYRDMLPVREVMDWFVQKGDRFHHSVLTAVPIKAASVSAQWVFRHFGAWIRTFHFVPSGRPGEAIPEYDQNKAEFLKRLSAADLFIDDNVSNVENTRRLGIKTMLFPRPWNENTETVTNALDRIEELLSQKE
jgi:hypothetical protein